MKKGKYVGISKVGEKGQIVIPKEARALFGIEPGDTLFGPQLEGQVADFFEKLTPLYDYFNRFIV